MLGDDDDAEADNEDAAAAVGVFHTSPAPSCRDKVGTVTSHRNVTELG